MNAHDLSLCSCSFPCQLCSTTEYTQLSFNANDFISSLSAFLCTPSLCQDLIFGHSLKDNLPLFLKCWLQWLHWNIDSSTSAALLGSASISYVHLRNGEIFLALFTEQFWKAPENSVGHTLTLTSFEEFLFALAFSVN